MPSDPRPMMPASCRWAARGHRFGRAGCMPRRRRCFAGVPDAGEQRNRRDPAGGAGRRNLPPARRIAACRCGPGGRTNPGWARSSSVRIAWRSRRTRWRPGGCGALLLAPDTPFAAPLIGGGGQERGRRGHIRVAPIAGFAAAAEAALDDDLLRSAGCGMPRNGPRCYAAR